MSYGLLLRETIASWASSLTQRNGGGDMGVFLASFIGAIVGASLGLVLWAMCIAASKRDDWKEDD